MDLFTCMRVFIRVSEVGSFTAVARMLNVSTPYVSRCVADLEASIQARLIQRNTRHQSLTEAGTRYLASCREIVARVDEAANEANMSCLRPKGCLRVQSDTEFGIEHLAAMINEYSKEYPDVSLDLTLTCGTTSIIDDHQDVQIVVSRRDHLPSSELVAQYLGDFSSVVCAAPAYLKRHGVPTTPQELINHVCLRQTDDRHDDDWAFETEEGTVVIPVGDGLKANLAQAICTSAIAGMGVCLLPDFVAAQALASGHLKRLLPTCDVHPRSVYALYSSRRFLDAKIKTWVDYLKTNVPHQLGISKKITNTPAYFADSSVDLKRLRSAQTM